MFWILAALLLAPPASAESLEALLARGEVTLLETSPDGRLKQATAIVLVHRPVEEVWAKLVDFGAYATWMPQCEASTVVSEDGGETVVEWTVAVVGPNVTFREAFRLDAARHVVEGRWVSGALSGSHWRWELVPSGADTLVYRRLYTNVVGSNWLVRQAEDENHSLEYGINVATGVIQVRGLKRALEGE